MSILEALFGGLMGGKPPTYEHHARPHKDTVNLKLVSVTYSGLSTETEHTVRRDLIQKFCDDAAEVEGVQEVTVYEEIFHHKHDSHPSDVEAIGPGAVAAFTALRTV